MIIESDAFHLESFQSTMVCRFITDGDKEWFDVELINTVRKELGEEASEILKDPKYFVDFMRDAPEPTGEEVEDTDMELPKIYEPIESFKALEERLKYFLEQYNDIIRGSDMDLVSIDDSSDSIKGMLHVPISTDVQVLRSECEYCMFVSGVLSRRCDPPDQNIPCDPQPRREYDAGGCRRLR